MKARRWPVCLGGLLACIVLGAPVSARAEELTLPSGFRDTTAFSGLGEPTMVRFAPNGEVFVSEKTGTILVYESLADKTPEQFADLSTPVYDNGDRGLLSIAIDPDFPARPYVYALYTFDHVAGEDAPGAFPHWGDPDHPKGDPCPKPPDADVDACPVSGRLVRLSAEIGPGEDHAVEAAGAPREEVLLEDWCQQDSSHSIGDLEFGPEGALYVSGGDGAGYVSPDYGQIGWPHPNQCGDPPGKLGEADPLPLAPPAAEGGSLRAQDVLTPEDPLTHEDPTTLDGSILRIDPDSGEGWPSNPLADSTDPNARRIVAFGFRNPFRFALDPSGEDLYVDNVGSSEYEEIDQVPTQGADAYNSGWPCYEGPERQFQWRVLGLNVCEGLYAEPEAVARPLFDYSHDAGVLPGDPCPYESGSAISGNAVYGGDVFPAEYGGALFFADSVRACMYVMTADDDGHPDPGGLRVFGIGNPGVYPGVDIEPGPEGDLYYVQMLGPESAPGSFGPGSIHRISYDPGAPTARLQADRTYGPTPLEVHFDATGSSDPDGEQLSYEWDFNDDGSFEAGQATKAHTFSTAENATVALRVKDPTGKSSVAQLTVYPGDEPPSVEILEPEETLRWHVGQKIDFAGRAEDAEGEDLRYTHLYWSSRLFHCPGGPTSCHTHPLQVFPAVESGSLIAPDHDYPSHISITLTATDGRGLSASSTVLLDPSTVDLRLASDPAGVPLTAGASAAAAPFTLTAIEGAHLTISAPPVYEAGGRQYRWEGWSDGGAAVHTILADHAAEYTASYSALALPGPSPQSNSSTPPPESGSPPGLQPRLTLVRGPRARTGSTSARFVFAASAAGLRYLCKLDRGRFQPCRSPKVYRHLRPGRHTFRVAAADAGGQPYGRIVKDSWLVLGKRG